MQIKNITRKNNVSIGIVNDNYALIKFVNGATPTEGNIKIIDGTLIRKNNKNYYYVKNYMEA